MSEKHPGPLVVEGKLTDAERMKLESNYLRGTIIGHGDVPVVQCLRALKGAGYDGYLAIEFEGMEDCMMGIQIGLNNLKKYVAEVYGA